jgi:hypothetical protein
MFDLETWGTNPGCAIRSIGAIVFDPNDVGAIAHYSSFYRNIEDGSCLMAGLLLEPSTVNWWAEQSAEASNALKVDAKPLTVAVVDFHNWFKTVGGEFIWCHGANFDEPIWKAAALRVGQALPWKFWNVRCTRTCYATAGFDCRTVERKGVAHNALDDAVYQAECVQRAMAKLQNRNTQKFLPAEITDVD